jgi:hypothetical protein
MMLVAAGCCRERGKAVAGVESKALSGGFCPCTWDPLPFQKMEEIDENGFSHMASRTNLQRSNGKKYTHTHAWVYKCIFHKSKLSKTK